jgi:hypothetical protein
MNVSPTKVNRYPVACITTISCGATLFPWLTKYAGPSSGTGRIGVIALAEATTDALGHPAGFTSNTTAVHAFCNVVNRTLLGQIHLDSATFASSV